MIEKYKFQRNYFIFELEDKGYGAGKEPAGYIKIEIRKGKGKLSALVQDIKEGSDYSYILSAFDCSKGSIIRADIGKMQVFNNKAEIHLEFNPYNLLYTGRSIDDFSVFAVLVDSRKSKGSTIICPLAAYRNKKVNWRGMLREKEINAAEYKQKEDKDKYEEKKIIEIKDEYVEDLKKYENYNIEYGEENREEHKEDDKEENIKEDIEENIEKNAEKNAVVNTEINAEKKTEEYIQEYKQEYKDEKTDISKECKEEEREVISEEKQNFRRWHCPVGISSCKDCEILRTNEQPLVQQSEQQPDGSPDRPFDFVKLAEYFNKYLEKSDPFNSRRRDYRWWEVSTPTYLNSILYQFGIRTSEIFNTNVMMAYLKYRHLIVGIYTDRIRQRGYVVFGVPGTYSVDGRPLGSACRWVQLKGNRPREGAFGYWLAYYEPESEELLDFN